MIPLYYNTLLIPPQLMQYTIYIIDPSPQHSLLVFRYDSFALLYTLIQWHTVVVNSFYINWAFFH